MIGLARQTLPEDPISNQVCQIVISRATTLDQGNPASLFLELDGGEPLALEEDALAAAAARVARHVERLLVRTALNLDHTVSDATRHVVVAVLVNVGLEGNTVTVGFTLSYSVLDIQCR